RRARMRGGRRRRCEVRRGGEALRGEEGSAAHGRRPCRALPETSHRLQGAAVDRVPQRAAEEQRGENPAPRAARRGTKEGRVKSEQGDGEAGSKTSCVAHERTRPGIFLPASPPPCSDFP